MLVLAYPIGQETLCSDTLRVDLQVQPLGLSTRDVLHEIDASSVDVVGLTGYNRDGFWDRFTGELDRDHRLREDFRVEFLNGSAIKYRGRRSDFSANEVILLRGQELNSREGFHCLCYGHGRSLDDVVGAPMKEIIHACHERKGGVVIAHPFVHIAKNHAATIPSYKIEILEKTCMEEHAFRPDGLEWNGHCYPWLRKLLLGEDVNARAEEFCRYLKERGIDMSLVPTTDLHASKPEHLRYAGTAGVVVRRDSLKGCRSSASFAEKLVATIRRGDFTVGLDEKRYAPFMPWLMGYGLRNIEALFKSRK